MKTAGIYGILWESMSIKMQIQAGPRSPYTLQWWADEYQADTDLLQPCSTDPHWCDARTLTNSFIAPLIKHYLEQTLQGAHRS